jgi:hypothetical protein
MFVASSIGHIDDDESTALTVGGILRDHVIVQAVMKHALTGPECYGYSTFWHPSTDVGIKAPRPSGA